jgi:DNA repair ATPase RecN
MKIKEIMERAGISATGRAIAYIKDALAEMNSLSEIHIKTAKIDIEEGKRFYQLPNEMVKILDIRCKHHDNTSNKYRSIPRSVYEPEIEDEDGI